MMQPLSDAEAALAFADHRAEGRISPEEFLALDLEVHELLKDVPLRDVTVVDLPDGGSGRTVADARRLFHDSSQMQSAPVRALFELRRVLGKVFGWDAKTTTPVSSFTNRLSEDQRARSLTPPGSMDGPFRLVYDFPLESLGEIRNATVHAFACSTLQPRAGGYRFYLAVYVADVSPLTPVYMAVIEPFRRFIVYPAMMRKLRAAWVAAYPADGRLTPPRGARAR
jgi:hypothetical protein